MTMVQCTKTGIAVPYNVLEPCCIRFYGRDHYFPPVVLLKARGKVKEVLRSLATVTHMCPEASFNDPREVRVWNVCIGMECRQCGKCRE